MKKQIEKNIKKVNEEKNKRKVLSDPKQLIIICLAMLLILGAATITPIIIDSIRK